MVICHILVFFCASGEFISFLVKKNKKLNFQMSCKEVFWHLSKRKNTMFTFWI